MTTNGFGLSDATFLEYNYRSSDNPAEIPDGYSVVEDINVIDHAETGVRIDFLKNDNTGEIVVITRGSANIQNIVADISLEENKPFREHIDEAKDAILTYSANNPGENNSFPNITFIAHSYGVNCASLLANEVYKGLKGNGIEISDIENKLTVRGYNGAGIPKAPAELMSNLGV